MRKIRITDYVNENPYERIQRKSYPVLYTDSPSSMQLEVLTLDIAPRNEATFGNVRNALRAIEHFVQDDVRIHMIYREYDCTGQSFTSGLDLISREIHRGMDYQGMYEVEILVVIYKHYISIDV